MLAMNFGARKQKNDARPRWRRSLPTRVSKARDLVANVDAKTKSLPWTALQFLCLM
jgi:hypothetical protein